MNGKQRARELAARDQGMSDARAMEPFFRDLWLKLQCEVQTACPITLSGVERALASSAVEKLLLDLRFERDDADAAAPAPRPEAP